MQKNNSVALGFISLALLLFSLPLVWMSIHSAQFDGLPEAFNQFMPSAFGSGSVTANGFNGSVTFLVKLPIWLFVAIGAIGILINISNTLRITSTPKLIPLLFLSFSAFYVAVALCVSVWSSDASMEIGNTVAIIGLVAGFFSTLKSPYQTS